MEFLNWLKQYAGKLLLIPFTADALIWVAKLVNAAADGKITDQEFHQLSGNASAAAMGVLFVVMVALKVNGTNNKQ